MPLPFCEMDNATRSPSEMDNAIFSPSEMDNQLLPLHVEWTMPLPLHVEWTMPLPLHVEWLIITCLESITTVDTSDCCMRVFVLNKTTDLKTSVTAQAHPHML